MNAKTQSRRDGWAIAPAGENVVYLKMTEQNKGSLSSDRLCQLMQKVGSGQDREAFAELFGYFAPRMKSFFMRSGISAAASEDLAQETMLAVWRKASYFDPMRAGVSTWVFTIARNQRIDRLRQDGRQSLIRECDLTAEPGHVESAEEGALITERAEQVRCAMDALSQEQARIVHLSFFAEKPHSEIALELGIPLGTVKSRIRTAVQRLRKLLDSTP